EEQGIAALKARRAVRGLAARLDAEEPGARYRLEEGSDARVHPHRRELLVVEARTTHGAGGELEAERLHEMKRCTGVGCEADDIARVGRNLGLVQHDVKHGLTRTALTPVRKCSAWRAGNQTHRRSA